MKDLNRREAKVFQAWFEIARRNGATIAQADVVAAAMLQYIRKGK